MRFDELTIEKYGVYSCKNLDLAGTPGLAVLYGPNEAGKSTTLSAVVDFLYGIPPRTQRAQVYGGPAIAITAKLRLADRSHLTLKRTKGNTRTLTDGAGVWIDDTALTVHLGVNSRDRFLAIFALNHESLRSGGEQLLDAKGDIGRLIVEAGGGLRSLAAEMADLGARADALYGPRKSDKRRFYIELERYQEADRQVKAGLVTVDVYERVNKELGAATNVLDDLRRKLLALRESHRSLERIARVCPLLHQLDRENIDLAAYVDLPTVALDFAQQVRGTVAARAEAAKSLKATQTNLEELKSKAETLQPAQILLDLEADIADAATWGVHVSKERKDREERRLELAKSRSRLEGLRRLTGLAPDADISSVMPTSEELARVRSLAAESTRLQTEIRGLESGVNEAELRIKQLRARQAEREERGYHQPLGFDAAAFAGIDNSSRDLGLRRAQIEELSAEISRRVQALGFESAGALAELTLPDDAALHTEIDRMAAQDEELRQLKDTIKREARRKSAKAAEIAGLRGAGEPPTDEAIASARQVRLAAWEPIRDGYLKAVSSSELPLEKRTEAVKFYEGRSADADGLVDRKSSEAGRVADLKLAEQELIAAERCVLDAQTEINEIEERAKLAAAAWLLCWPDARKLHEDPNRLKVKLAERAAILELDTRASNLKAETGRLASQVESGLESICEAEKRLGIATDVSARLLARLHAVTERVRQHENEYADYRAAKKAVDDESARLIATNQALEGLKIALTEWDRDWSAVVSRLLLKPDASPALATEAAAEWAAAAGVLDAINLTQQRLDKMERDENRLNALISNLSPKIETDLPSDIVAASAMLKVKLDEALRLQSARAAFEQQAAALAPTLERAANALALAEAAVCDLCNASGCEESELAAIAVRFEARSACLEKIRQTEQTLLASGDQLPIDALREQVAGRELDQIYAAIEEEKELETTLLAQMETAVKEEERLKQQLAGYASGEDINRPVAERESAAAAMRQAVADYLELVLAKELIEQAMAEVREQQQDPLLARAGALFQQTTIGAFGGIRADVDERGNPSVVGVRSGSGERVAIDAMSDGTRDQLFLAFRVAVVEQYCANAEPLPFIADDLLVHFDDGRSQAALELLAELGKTTQVLLFTHHAQVKNDAEKMGLRTIDLG